MNDKTIEPSYTDHTSILAAARTVRNQRTDGKSKGSDNMKRARKLGPVRNERGVALLVALAVLVLMAILAVSFYSSQDIESMAAANAKAQRSAEAIAESGLEWAMALIESDLSNNTVLAYDTNFDIWGLRANEAGHNPDVLFNTGSGNEVDLSLLVGGNDARWIPVRTAERVVGRFAAIIEDENGMANVNVAGNANNAQADGLSPAELRLQTILGAIPSGNSAWADAMIQTRNGAGNMIGTSGDDDGDAPAGYLFCDDDLDGTADPGDANDATNEPDERNMYDLKGNNIALLDLTTAFKDVSGTMDQRREWLGYIRDYISVNSRTQNVYKLKPADDSTANDWAEQLSVNTADAAAIRAKLSDLQTAGRLPATADIDQVAANIADFIDADSDPQQLNGKHGIEKTAYINEVEASPAPPPLPTGPNGEPIYDYGEFIELINPYDVPVTVTVVGVPMLAGGTQDIKVTVPARTDDSTPGFYVITDTSGTYTPAMGGGPVDQTNLPALPSFSGDPGWDLSLPDSGPLTLQTSSGDTIEVVHYPSAGTDDNQTAQKDDPRVDEWDTDTDTMGGMNTNIYKPSKSGDKDADDTALSKLFVVYNGKVGAVGHLGQVHTGAKWATINLQWDPAWNEDFSPCENETWLNIYDVFTTKESDLATQPVYGLININTAPSYVLQGLKGVDSTIADAIVNHVTSSRRFESIGALGYFLKDLTPNSTSWEKEKHLADIAGLVTVRSHVFRVTVLAQAVDRQGKLTSERKLEASVLRTIDTGNGKPTVRVLSMRWLTEE
jgi:hypothetical protein